VELSVIDNFGKGTDHWFLSNFYQGDQTLKGRLYGYPTTEHFYQAMKTLDPTRRVMIMAVDTPGSAKRMGNSPLHKLRPGWDAGIKNQVMSMALALKFAPGTPLAQLLMDTQNARLIEGNWWHDTYWGVCNGECNKGPHEPKGQNMLGIMLMSVRNLLLCQPEYP
jgi:ribA/ribD-fused uncharacterized protein